MTVDEQIRKIIIDKLDVTESEVTPQANIGDDLGADSLDKTELMMAIEDEFKITIREEESASLCTVQHVYDYVNNRVGLRTGN